MSKSGWSSNEKATEERKHHGVIRMPDRVDLPIIVAA
jgi:hypothetical protein